MSIKPVINLADLKLRKMGDGGGFEAEVASFADQIGSTGVDCMLHVVQPGKKAFPRHSHRQEHELFVILEGEGAYRFGNASYPIRAGDVCAGPTGGPETAHQIVNTGSTTLRYLGIAATRAETEVCEYPDSGKVAVFFGGTRHIFGKNDTSRGYHEGES